MKHHPDRQYSTKAWRLKFLAIGLASLLWLIVRSGTKPSRMAYPCQRMAAANVSAWLGVAVAPALIRTLAGFKERVLERSRMVVPIAGVLFTAFLIVFFAGSSSRPVDSQGVSAVDAGEMQGMGQIQLELEQNLAGPPTPSDIFVVQGTDGADGGFTALVRMLEADGGGFYRRERTEAAGTNIKPGIIGTDDVVIIKVNSQWDERGGTNTDLVASIVRSICDHPDGFTGEVIIADNGQGQYGVRGRGGSLDWDRNNAIEPAQSMQDVARSFADRYRVSVYLWDDITTNEVAEFSEEDSKDGYVVADKRSPATEIIVSYPKFTTRYGTHVSFARGIWNSRSNSYDSDGLVVINVPVLKSHAIYGVTGAVKHYMGVVSDKLTSHNAHRSVGSGGMGTEMAETRVPALNVIDAIWVNAQPGRGPSTPYRAATETNIIAASRDPVALDTWASLHVLVAAAERQGEARTGLLNPLEQSGSGFSKWLALSARELQKAGYPATTDLSDVNVRVEKLP